MVKFRRRRGKFCGTRYIDAVRIVFVGGSRNISVSGEKFVGGIIRRGVVDVVIFGGRKKCIVVGIFGWRHFGGKFDGSW